MKKSLLLLLFFIGYTLAGQQTIAGTLSPSDDYKWLIAYHLRPDTQEYIANSAVIDGQFSLNIPPNAPIGTYRIVYAVPQEEFYFDVLYNAKENIELTFNNIDGIAFTSSQNNTAYHSYFNEIAALEQKLIDFYTSQNTDKKEFIKITDALKATQKYYENSSKGLMASNFIKANSAYIPSKYEPIQQYILKKKAAYFNTIDFEDPVLQSSNFLTDKVLNYVFTALPLKELSKAETEREMQKNVKKVYAHLKGTKDVYKLRLLYKIWARAKENHLNTTCDFIYGTYIGPLAKKTDAPDIVENIELYNRLRLGAMAPEITWKSDKGPKTLSAMNGAQYYVLVFWSSGCSHCLRELPQLEKNLKDNTSVKVLAIGLEDNMVTWGVESAKLTSFEHAISLGKWESEYADLYNISATPTYFILDSDKKIIAKPEDYIKVSEFLKKKLQ